VELSRPTGLSQASFQKIKVHRVREPTPEPLAGLKSGDGVAGLMGALVDLKALAAPFEHLRHERKSVEAAVSVQRCEDFLPAANLNPIAGG
jgi:hypothetical protein